MVTSSHYLNHIDSLESSLHSRTRKTMTKAFVLCSLIVGSFQTFLHSCWYSRGVTRLMKNKIYYIMKQIPPDFSSRCSTISSCLCKLNSSDQLYDIDALEKNIRGRWGEVDRLSIYTFLWWDQREEDDGSIPLLQIS